MHKSRKQQKKGIPKSRKTESEVKNNKTNQAETNIKANQN